MLVRPHPGTRWNITAIASLLALGTSLVYADIYGLYQGLEKQIGSAAAIVVFKLYVPPPAPPSKVPSTYDPTNGTLSGILNPTDIEILGSLKGTLDSNTTLTAGIGSFGFRGNPEKFGLAPASIPGFARLKPGQAYLTFMESAYRDSAGVLHAKSRNVELNLLKVTGNGPYQLLEKETVEQAITRLTGLNK